MEHLYIDESGSMTNLHHQSHPYFVIAVVRAVNSRKIRTLYKRFVNKHFETLRNIDTQGKMFKNGAFQELKGSSFTPELKHAFVNYFCRSNDLEVYYIQVNNNNPKANVLYKNTSRAFNYVLKLALEYWVSHHYLPDAKYEIHLDERNEKTESRSFLQDYLNTELFMQYILSSDINVKYFDSSQNKIIQIADVFANLYYSELLTGNYSQDIHLMRKQNCLKFVFRFPLT